MCTSSAFVAYWTAVAYEDGRNPCQTMRYICSNYCWQQSYSKRVLTFFEYKLIRRPGVMHLILTATPVSDTLCHDRFPKSTFLIVKNNPQMCPLRVYDCRLLIKCLHPYLHICAHFTRYLWRQQRWFFIKRTLPTSRCLLITLFSLRWVRVSHSIDRPPVCKNILHDSTLCAVRSTKSKTLLDKLLNIWFECRLHITQLAW